MSWLDQLQQGLIGGVAVQVDSSTDYVGRDKVVREYPFQDKPTIQDLGGVSKPGNFAAYVFGDDCFDRRDALVRVLNKPGAIDIVHPWMGLMRVHIVGPVAMKHSTQEGGVVRFDIEFVRAETTRYPKAAKNTARVVKQNTLKARLKAVNDFAIKFSVENLAGWATTSSFGAVGNAISDIQNTINSVVGVPAGYLTAFETQARLFTNVITDLSPEALGGGLMSLLGGFDIGWSLGGDDDVKTNQQAAFNSQVQRHKTLFTYTADYIPSPHLTPTREQEAANHDAVETLVQIGAILSAVDTISDADISNVWTYAEAMEWRAELNTAFQRVLDKADSNIYPELLNVMAAVSNDLVTRSQHLGRVTTITTRPIALPALLVSYEQYGTLGYADEIVSNNKIAHPLFIAPNSTLEVISHA